jgi:hypothetical protein
MLAPRHYFIGESGMRATQHYTVAWAAALLLMTTAPAGTAASVNPADQSLAQCQLPQPAEGSHPLASRAESLSRYEAMPPQCLKAMFLICTEAARTQLLDLGSAAACSIGYEALLRSSFGGNFQALMAWWHTQRSASTFAP